MKNVSSPGFSLIEVLASIVLLSSVAVGLTAVWKLVDQKELAGRLEHRATRILREYYELHTFAPSWADPFSANYSGSDAGADDPLSGFLYHPRASGETGTQAKAFGDAIPYTVTFSADGKQLILNYRISSAVGAGSHSMRKVIDLVE
jgi:prepilin-type N-terminal cleavage/methylation domain-containing protein